MGGRLWQEGYHDRVLRPEDDVRLYARYVLQNPVRAGLVEDVSTYKHAGSDLWSVSEILRDAPDPKGPAYVLSSIGLVRGADL